MYGNSISNGRGYDVGSYTYIPVVIIGAGESGIAMGCRLKEALGFDQFRIFDRQSGVGGTWWINRYPGVACDIPATFYSFSFCPNPRWSTFHPEGPEIAKYLQSVCEIYQIVDKIQLNSDIRRIRWLESDQIWEITIQHLAIGTGDLSEYDRAKLSKELGKSQVYVSEEIIRAKVVVSAVGGLVEPKVLPENIPGRERFRGQIFHSARWRYDVDLKDKNVIVIGTGCSAAQFVPRLTKDYGARSVVQIMRSPPWVDARPIPPVGEEWWDKWGPLLNTHVPGLNKALRLYMATFMECGYRLFGSGKFSAYERQRSERRMLTRMRTIVPEKYHEILTPNYPLGCKRRIFDASWYQGLNDPAIELTTIPLTSIGENTVTLGPGRTYPPESDTASLAPNQEMTLPAEVIILANGFETTKWLHPLEIIGRQGKELHDVFEEMGGPSMYMGQVLNGFPNFFTIFGPNSYTGHSSVILTSENQINLSLKFIKPILDGDVEIVEVKEGAVSKWTTEVQNALKNRVWHTGGCNNWYKSENGWNSNSYPYSQIWLGLCCKFPTWSDWNLSYTTKGQSKLVAKKILKYLLACTAIGLSLRLRRNPASLNHARVKMVSYICGILMNGSEISALAANKLRGRYAYD